MSNEISEIKFQNSGNTYQIKDTEARNKVNGLATINGQSLLNGGNIEVAASGGSPAYTMLSKTIRALNTDLSDLPEMGTKFSYDLSDYLPNDSHKYEVLVNIGLRVGGTVGTNGHVKVFPDNSTVGTVVAYTSSYSSSYNATCYDTLPVQVGSDKKMYLSVNGTPKDFTIAVRGYRALGASVDTLVNEQMNDISAQLDEINGEVV